MALPSAAAPVQGGHASGGTEYAEAVPAAAAPKLESLHKQEAAPTAVQDRPQADQVQPIAQSLTGMLTADGHRQLQISTLAPPQTSAAPPAEAQTAGETQIQAPKAATMPNTLDVICADVHGVLTMDFKSMRCFILHKGQEMTGTEFEKAAGREKAKKWKASVRVAPTYGNQGEMVGDWLQRHALDVRMSQLFKVGEARPGASRPPAAPRPSAPRPSAPRPAGPKPPPPNSTATLASVSDSAILEHLDKQFIGLQQGDPDVTFDKLPAGEPTVPPQPGMTLLDLRAVSYQQLMDLSAASAANPFEELLPFNPGVLPSRLGYMTGQQPKRQRVTQTAPDPTKARLQMVQYLSGDMSSAPWEAMGMSRAPVIGGRELDLRKFHEAVQECGGFDAAVSNKKFARIAVRLGIDLAVATNAAYLLKGYYQRLLAPYLQAVQTQAAAQQTADPVQTEAGRVDMQTDSEQAEADEFAVPTVFEDSSDRGGLDNNTIQQHSATLSARLKSQPNLVDSDDMSDGEDPLDQPLPLPADFKATVVDASGPIPGLEDL
ncbi:TPA: Lysine-specific demethylase 5A [Trebouxia sp. C0004]